MIETAPLGLSASRPLLGRNLTFGMAENLGRSIVRGTYGAAAFLNEEQLAREYGVSRSVTREAVKMLAAKGLLSGRPRQGLSVLPSSSWSLLDRDVLRWVFSDAFPPTLLIQFHELRLSIEPMAAALAATNSSPLARLQIEAAKSALVSSRSGGVFEARILLHGTILRGSGNPLFVQFAGAVQTALQSSASPRRVIAPVHGAPDLLDQSCRAILERDATAAQERMREMLEAEIALLRCASAGASIPAKSRGKRTSAGTAGAEQAQESGIARRFDLGNSLVRVG